MRRPAEEPAFRISGCGIFTPIDAPTVQPRALALAYIQHMPKRDGNALDLAEGRKPPGFTGNAPGGPSRWRTDRTGEWEPVDPKVVVEVAYDHFTGGRFRHGTKILRWRPDKALHQCTMDQVTGHEGRSLALL